MTPTQALIAFIRTLPESDQASIRTALTAPKPAPYVVPDIDHSTAPADPRWLTTHEAADYVGCSHTSVQRAIDAGLLSGRKIARKRLVTRVALDDWIDRDCPTGRHTSVTLTDGAIPAYVGESSNR